MVKIRHLKEYFQKRPEVAMAYLFGSSAEKRSHPESDVDVAIYFYPENKLVEWEAEKKYPEEQEIWADVESITDENVDLVVLNRCPATLALAILEKGKPLLVRDKDLWWSYYLAVSSTAVDFINFASEYYTVKQRSASLSELDRHNLRRRLDFLKNHLEEFGDFQNLTLAVYTTDRNRQRITERWVENIINATLDIAKIILASQKIEIPKSYRETLKMFAIWARLDEEETRIFSQFAGLRNILAHEYLDLLFEKIREFIDRAEPIYQKLVSRLEKELREC